MADRVAEGNLQVAGELHAFINDEALRNLTAAFGSASDPGLTRLRAALEAGEKLAFEHVAAPRDGLAEVFYSIAAALLNEAQPDYTLLPRSWGAACAASA